MFFLDTVSLRLGVSVVAGAKTQSTVWRMQWCTCLAERGGSLSKTNEVVYEHINMGDWAGVEEEWR